MLKMFPKSVLYLICLCLMRSLFEREILSADTSDEHNPCVVGLTDSPSSSTLRTPLPADKLKNLGNDFFRESKHDEAHRCYSMAIDIYPDEAKYYRNRALNYERMQQIDLALADYRASLEYEPYSVKACFSIGQLLHKRGEYVEAADFLQKALDYGDEPHMANDESQTIRSVLEEAREKIEEIEMEKQKHRRKELINYLRELINKDTEKKLARTENDDQRQRLLSHRTDYMKELEMIFNDQLPPIPLPRNVVPQYVCDVINFDVMRNPVITPSGVTYEEVEIMRHLASKNFDPVSRKPLRPDQLRPNKLLKVFIDSFMRRHGLTYHNINQYACDRA